MEETPENTEKMPFSTITSAILEIADAINGHSKSIDGLSQNVRHSFRDDYDNNVADMLGEINSQLVMFNKLIEEAGRLLDITRIGQTLKERI